MKIIKNRYLLGSVSLSWALQLLRFGRCILGTFQVSVVVGNLEQNHLFSPMGEVVPNPLSRFVSVLAPLIVCFTESKSVWLANPNLNRQFARPDPIKFVIHWIMHPSDKVNDGVLQLQPLQQNQNI